MRKSLDDIQGSWAVKALEVDGQEMPASMLGEARIVVKGKRFASTGMGAEYEGTVELEGGSTPGHIDMKFDAGPEKGNTNRGIYEIKGNTWKLCLATRGSVRPSSFASTPGSGFAVETLVRERATPIVQKRSSKKAAALTPSRAPLTEIEGEWSMLSGTMDGKPMEDSLVKWVKRVTQGNLSTVYAGPQIMLKVEFTCDPSSSPKQIHYLNLAGSNKGKTQDGIYELKQDLLTICVATPGAKRPGEFKSQPGDGRALTAWKKA